jgi:hypothetical protein
MNESALRIVIAAWCAAAGAVSAFSPDTKELCKSSGVIDPARLIAKLFDDEGLSDWQLDTDGKDVTPQIRALAITNGDFCKGRACAEKGQAKLRAATSDLEQFLKRVKKGDAPHYSAVPPLAGANEVKDYLVEGKFAVVCTVAQGDQPPTPPTTPGLAAKELTFMQRLGVRGTVNDLLPSAASYKSLSSATFSADRDSISAKNKYGVSGVVGFALDRLPLRAIGGYADPTLFLISAVKKTVSTPAASGNVNVEGAGILFNTLFRAGFPHNLKIAPQVIRDFQDKSNTALVNVTYTPEPACPYIGGDTNVAKLFYAKIAPTLNYTYGNVLTNAGSTSLAVTGRFDRFGPGLDVRLFGEENTMLEPLAIIWSTQWLHTSGEVGVDSLRYSQTSVSYSLGKPTDKPTGSITLKYTTGRDLNTLQPLRDLVLGLGFKY